LPNTLWTPSALPIFAKALLFHIFNNLISFIGMRTN
jgi:hypothetical protein